MALALRQKHLDEKLQIKDRPLQVFTGIHGREPSQSPGHPRGIDGPQFSGQLEDLRSSGDAGVNTRGCIIPRRRKRYSWNCCTVGDRGRN
jgi:hypothetical protein